MLQVAAGMLICVLFQDSAINVLGARSLFVLVSFEKVAIKISSKGCNKSDKSG